MAKNAKLYGIPPKDLLDLTLILLTGGSLENKLKEIGAKNSVWAMVDDLTCKYIAYITIKVIFSKIALGT